MNNSANISTPGKLIWDMASKQQKHNLSRCMFWQQSSYFLGKISLSFPLLPSFGIRAINQNCYSHILISLMILFCSVLFSLEQAQGTTCLKHFSCSSQFPLPLANPPFHSNCIFALHCHAI